jgi:hypothetical protein
MLIKKQYYSPVFGEPWTEEQYKMYVEAQEEKYRLNNECEDCYGCERCEG